MNLSYHQQRIVDSLYDQGYPYRELTREERRQLKPITEQYKRFQYDINDNCKGRNLTRCEYKEDRSKYCNKLKHCVYNSANEANKRYEAFTTLPVETYDPEHLAQLYYAINNYNRYRNWYRRQCNNYERLDEPLDFHLHNYNPLRYSRHRPSGSIGSNIYYQEIEKEVTITRKKRRKKK